MREELSTADRRVALIAGRQHGVVTVGQLRAAGVRRTEVTRRVQAGRLHRLHRGVYAVGHRSLSWRGRWLAAVLASGDGAVLSNSSAAALWQFIRPVAGPVHVTVPSTRRPKPRPGIVIHRSRELVPADHVGHRGAGSIRDQPYGAIERHDTAAMSASEPTVVTYRHDITVASQAKPTAASPARPTVVTRRHGIAVTTAARTIEDVRPELEPHLFRRALRQAELAGHRVPNLAVTRRTRSDLELLFLSLCEEHGLPRPEVNARIAGRLVDFLFREHRLAVETDSWTYHRGSVAFEDDHARDLALRAQGLAVRRYTGEQLETAPEAVAADLRQALGLGQ